MFYLTYLLSDSYECDSEQCFIGRLLWDDKKKSLAIDQEGALRTSVRTIAPEEIHSASRSKYMWAYEREIPYVAQRDGFVKHIVCLGNYQPGGQPFVHILIIIVKLIGSLGLILSDNLEQFSHKYCEHCFLFLQCIKKAFVLGWRERKKDFWNFSWSILSISAGARVLIRRIQ